MPRFLTTMLYASISKSWIISRNLPEMKELMGFPEKEKHEEIEKLSLCRKQSNVTNEGSELCVTGNKTEK